MKVFILITLCLVLSQQAVLIASSPSNTAINSPPLQTVVVEPYHSVNPPTTIPGTGAQWIHKSGGASWPDGDVVTFYTQFYADCLNPITLQITADNIFSAKLNGGAPVTGNDWTKFFNFTFSDFKCGVNTLEIVVTNRDRNSPSGLIFAVTQDESGCYSCRSPLSFYNRNTCSCECLQGCDCKRINPNYSWQPYPTCGCKCGFVGKCAQRYYWDQSSCSCQCKPFTCLPGFSPNRQTCQCVRKCDTVCIGIKVVNPLTCKCVCPRILVCAPPLRWSNAVCQCINKIAFDLQVATIGNDDEQ